MLMKNARLTKETKSSGYCSCHGGDHDHGHHYCEKPIILGLALLVIGVALERGYKFPQVIMLIGGILIVKGILALMLGKPKMQL